MNDLRTAAQQALEALESVLCDPDGKCCIDGSDADRAVVDKALTALERALAQQAEPVAGNTLLKAFLAAAKEAGVTHLRQVEAALYPVLEQQAEPKPMHPELRKMWEDHFDKCFRTMPVPEQAEPDTCTWQQDGDSDSGVYGTSCGHYFQIEDGTPADNKMAWCCYCGKKLAQELITENEDD